jgi:hypothetical protein
LTETIDAQQVPLGRNDSFAKLELHWIVELVHLDKKRWLYPWVYFCLRWKGGLVNNNCPGKKKQYIPPTVSAEKILEQKTGHHQLWERWDSIFWEVSLVQADVLGGH